MIPGGGDPSSRTLLLRRVSSWSDVVAASGSASPSASPSNNDGDSDVNNADNDNNRIIASGNVDENHNQQDNERHQRPSYSRRRGYSFNSALNNGSNNNDGNNNSFTATAAGEGGGRRRGHAHRRGWSYGGDGANINSNSRFNNINNFYSNNNNNISYSNNDGVSVSGDRGDGGVSNDNGDQESLVFFSSSFDDTSSSLSQRLLIPNLEYEDESDAASSSSSSVWSGIWRMRRLSTIVRDKWLFCHRRVTSINWKLWTVFVLLVLSGVGNVLLAKLSSRQLYNYPTFLNIYSNTVYCFVSFAYIIPVGHFGLFHRSIPKSHWTSLPKFPFAIMGLLDAVSATIQWMANVYLPGTLLVLIPQAAIPLSMVGSYFVLREKYTARQFFGAIIVLSGVFTALLPVFTHQREADFYCRAIDEENHCTICQLETTEDGCLSHRSDDDNTSWHNHTNSNNQTDLYCTWISRDLAVKDDDFLVFIWSLFMLFSLIPMVMSTIYKQVALQVHLDPILVNGWVSVFQLIFGVVLVLPAGMLSSPRVHPSEIGANWNSGAQCLFQRSPTVELGCHPDDCNQTVVWVHIFLVISIVFTISMMLTLKFGSTDLLYFGLTLAVPLSHLGFSLHHSTVGVRVFDVCGLIISVAGLFIYRFGHKDPSTTLVGVEDEAPGESPAEDEVNGDYRRLASGEDEVETTDELTTDDSLREILHCSYRQDVVDVDSDDKGGFLEFLRDPFLLVGDI
mmetsp:Transcript_52065/g.125694  ORF Transcript_52065/g.125694 Transcript_52065/m.125694 type:complete len:734 (-) Transcript_52065:1380-3581(-)